MALNLIIRSACTSLPRYLGGATKLRSLSTKKNESAPSQQKELNYRVCRTHSNLLPIYHLEKNGGNKKITKIRKIEGDLMALKDDLKKALNLDDKECTINSLTGHVLVKGHRKYEIAKFLTDQNF